MEQKQQSNDRTDLFVMRHGERYDFAFPDWLSTCFTEDGKFIRKDLNMHERLPIRKDYPQVYATDTPITNLGVFEAKLIGEALKTAGVTVNHVYSSPAIRCIMTCDGVLQGLGIKDCLPIRLEPAAYEWLTWCKSGVPQWMTVEELTVAGFNIDTVYEPFMSKEQLNEQLDETCEQYYHRNYHFVEKTLQHAKGSGIGGNVLIVAHASSVDSCTRQITGHPARDEAGLNTVLYKAPYCSFIKAKEDSDGKYRLTEPPIPPVSNTVNKVFNWKDFL